MTWLYLPVFVTLDESREYSFCEVYLDNEGRVKTWTESHEIAPSGETLEELQADLQHMLDDLARWEPVELSTLARGMVLRPSPSKRHIPF